MRLGLVADEDDPNLLLVVLVLVTLVLPFAPLLLPLRGVRALERAGAMVGVDFGGCGNRRGRGAIGEVQRVQSSGGNVVILSVYAVKRKTGCNELNKRQRVTSEKWKAGWILW